MTQYHLDYNDVKATIMRQLRKKETVTSEIIREEIRILVSGYYKANLIDKIDENLLFREISSQISVWQPDPSVLRDRNHVNWVPEAKAKVQWGFWKRYREYLEEEKGWSNTITAKLDSITDSVLGDIGNPREDTPWDRRGMVVGDVQSGKTANYTGLICKATDAGYKLIIVLAGATNDLRSQTQSRLDAEFLGFESEVGKLHNNASKIGVGKLADHGGLIAQPLTYSSKDGDFRAKTGTNIQLGGNPLLLVVKKNTSVLKRILKWVEGQGVSDPNTKQKVVKNIPLLLLDDEADYASVNTKPDEEDDPTAINKSIRKILKVFSQSSYIGYTATPFANIFILPEDHKEDPSVYGADLFPENFIYYINPPDNYVGAAEIFGLGNCLDGIDEEDCRLPLTRSVYDAEDVFPSKHNKLQPVDYLPDSLVEAIHSFILVCAARRVRGQKSVHNSMLIHVTRFNLVQEQVIELVSTELVNIQRTLEYNTGHHAKKLMLSLKSLWEKDFSIVTKQVVEITKDETLVPISWDEVSKELYEAASRIEVRGINGLAGGQLDYSEHHNGLNVIAIGGDKLSRGLTLESLSVSYYVRPARNYDTLLQMGRWFGYRPGYLDLCRLYTTDELAGWYQHIAMASEELKREFKLMELSRLTPKDYGLKVRTHPNGLNITSANKIRNGTKMQATFSGHLSQTTVFYKNKDIQEHNFLHTDNWLSKMQPCTHNEKNKMVWNSVPPEDIINFLSEFRTHPLSRRAAPDLLIKYIKKLNTYGELTSWTVALLSNSSTADNFYPIAGQKFGLIKRKDTTPNGDLYIPVKSNILNPPDQYIDFSKNLYEKALNATIRAWESGDARAKDKPKLPSGPFVRMTRPPSEGLLLLYPLDSKSVTLKGEAFTDKPIIGFAISFPKGSKDENVEYQVNSKYWKDRFGDTDEDI